MGKSILKAVKVLSIALQLLLEQILLFNIVFNAISLPVLYTRVSFKTFCQIITRVGFTEVIFRRSFCFEFENSILASGLVNYACVKFIQY